MAVLPLQAMGAVAASADPALVNDPASLVNPLIGTSGAVDTFPGPDMPFGMMQLGPDTTPDRTYGGGYEYKDKKLSGFSLTHVSGPGCSAGGDVPILPVGGRLAGSLSNTSVGFSHSDEHTGIGYYGVTDSSGITTELTDTTRAGLGRFTFPSGQSNLLLKLSSGATQVDGTRAQVVNDHEVVGAVQSGHFCGADNTYTLHFDIRFDQPFSGTGTWSGSTISPNTTSLRHGRPQQTLRSAIPLPQRENHFTVPAAPSPTVHSPQGIGKKRADAAKSPVTAANGMYLSFGPDAPKTITAAIGISYTSDANAKLNLSKEVKGFGFDAMEKANHAAWNAVLDKARVGGGTHDQQVQFYTALYHALLHPNVFSDVNGQYMGMDDQVHTLKKGQQAQYATYSGWDTYRSQTQLMATLEPKIASDVVTSMLNGYDQTGLLPKWAQNNGESYVMVGDPADGIIADAYAFGARDFDTQHALAAMEHEATATNNDRPGESVRDAKGYLPLDESDYGCCNFYGPVSTQLEYDAADYAIASFAKSLGRAADYTRFASRAQDWQNVFNPVSGYMQAKDAGGEFAPGFTPGTSDGFVEGTSAQYTPMVPFNIQGLISARGGTQAYSSYLDGLLSNITNPTSVDANLSNEPSLEIPWEYDYLGRPWKTQEAVRQAQQKLYFDAPVGSFGNDDLGAMSSWYVWSELGMYPETPGTGTLALGSPGFPRAELALGSGRTLTIDAPNAAADTPYVQSLAINGRSSDAAWTTFAAIDKGGSYDYALASTPNTGWATKATSVPPSDATGERDVFSSAGPGGAGLVIAPGGSGTGTLDLSNIGHSALRVAWTAHAPAAVTTSASSGTLSVPAGGRAEAKVTVTAGTTEGDYPVTFDLTGADGASLGTAVMRVAVAQPDELWPYYTGEGVYADGAAFSGGFDGGGRAYSQNALQAAGVSSGTKLTVNGITYTWPRTAAGQQDNIEMAGQTIPVPSGTSAGSLGLLGAATDAPAGGSSGTLTVTYTDGTTSTAKVGFSDWTLNAGAGKPFSGETEAVTTAYRDTGSGQQDPVKTYVFAVKVALTPGRTVASLTLPTTSNGTSHLFALGYGS